MLRKYCKTIKQWTVISKLYYFCHSYFSNIKYMNNLRKIIHSSGNINDFLRKKTSLISIFLLCLIFHTPIVLHCIVFLLYYILKLLTGQDCSVQKHWSYHYGWPATRISHWAALLFSMTIASQEKPGLITKTKNVYAFLVLYHFPYM